MPLPSTPSRSDDHSYALSGSDGGIKVAKPESITSCSVVTTVPAAGRVILTTGALAGTTSPVTSADVTWKPSETMTRMVPSVDPPSLAASMVVDEPLASFEIGLQSASAVGRYSTVWCSGSPSSSCDVDVTITEPEAGNTAPVPGLVTEIVGAAPDGAAIEPISRPDWSSKIAMRSTLAGIDTGTSRPTTGRSAPTVS